MGSSDVKSTKKTSGSTKEEVLIYIICSNGPKMTVPADLKSTVAVFKEVVARSCDVPADQLRLIYKGRVLKDDQTLQSYGLQAEHTVHMVSGPSTTSTVNEPIGGGTNSEASVGGATPGAATGGVVLRDAPLPGVDISFLYGPGRPRMDQMQQFLTQNSDMYRRVMNTPAVQNLMNNPELLRTTMLNHRPTQDMLARNPELAHMLNDPDMMRQGLETARNPEFMRVMTGYQGGRTAQTGSNVPNNGPNSTGSVQNSNPLPNPSGSPQSNTSTRTPSSAPRTAAVGGLGGLGAAQLNQMFQNPAMAQMVESVLSNPQHMNQLLSSDPQMREMMQNPEFLRQLNSPEMMQQLMTLHQSLLNQHQGSRGADPAGGAAAAVSPEEFYASQLSQLQDMGFFNTQENIRALQATSGNVQTAVARLRNNLGQ